MATCRIMLQACHNERKVTCKHPVSGQPSQDNCIFVVNEHPASKMQSHEKKDRPASSISEASNYTIASEYGTHPGSPLARDSTGMKLWKKRWFVLSDMCLFYYRDEKEEGILGSILLPSFHISMLSVDDHINRKYAFKATHPNMRTYYFCTDTAKEMESWMKVMTDAALVHSEPVMRIEKLKPEHSATQEVNTIVNHRVLTRPEALNNERNRGVGKLEETTKLKDAEKYGFQKEGIERPLTKINSVKVHRASHENENSTAAGSVQGGQYIPAQVNGAEERPGNISSADMGITPAQRQQQQQQQPQYHEPEQALQRTSSMMQLEQWVRTHSVRGQEDETRSITSYQTLPRNMPSYRAQIVPHYPEAYRTLPRNSVTRPDSICSISASVYDRALGPVSTEDKRRALGPVSTEDKRRSMRDDTMWQLYEWQQRQAYAKQGPVGSYGTLSSPKTMINISDHVTHSIPPSPSHGSLALNQGYSPLGSYNMGSRSEVIGSYGTLSSPKTMINISDHVTHSIPPSPSHGSLALYQGYSPLGSYNMGSRSEVSSPVFRGDRHHRTHRAKPEELTLLLIKLRRQQAELSSVRERTLAQLVKLNLDATNPKAKLSRLCKQDKLVRTQEEKLQQLHREKHTLEQALLSASQEIEMNAENPAAIQSVIQQRDVLQNGLLSTCREQSRANAELERSWMEYDRLESDVTLAKNNLQEQLEKLGDQSESSSLHHANIQKELWRIQDVIEALGKNKPQRNKEDTGFSKPISDKHKSEEEESVPPRPPLPQSYDLTQRPPIVPPLPSDSSLQLHVSRGPVHRLEDRKTYHVQRCQRNGAHSGPDYRLYKSEPELTTVAEADESNGEEKTDTAAEKESSSVKGTTQECSGTALSDGELPSQNECGGADGENEAAPAGLTPREEERLCKMEESMSSNIKELEASLQGDELERNHETPAQEIARLKGAGQPGDCSVDKETVFYIVVNEVDVTSTRSFKFLGVNVVILLLFQLSTTEKVLIPERYIESDPEEVRSPEESADKQKKVDRIKSILAKNSMQNAEPVVNHKTEDHTEEEAKAQEQETILNISYDLAAEASKRSKLVAGGCCVLVVLLHGCVYVVLCADPACPLFYVVLCADPACPLFYVVLCADPACPLFYVVLCADPACPLFYVVLCADPACPLFYVVLCADPACPLFYVVLCADPACPLFYVVLCADPACPLFYVVLCADPACPLFYVVLCADPACPLFYVVLCADPACPLFYVVLCADPACPLFYVVLCADPACPLFYVVLCADPACPLFYVVLCADPACPLFYVVLCADPAWPLFYVVLCADPACPLFQVFVCLWKGCKVYNTPSTSQSWLQRHMLTHSGDKPFKCVVGGCNASFASQGGLARHVPTHFSQQNSSKVSSQPKVKEESPSKACLNKRKRLKNKRRRSLPRPHDFFDAQTMDAIRHRAICLNLATHIESLGNGHSVVFHSTVIARRKEDSGKVKILLHWTPEDILPDVWVNENDRPQLKTKVVHLSKLPQDTAVLLDPNIYR
ncbi:UNVERIFIED_CONTAM: hypothetical protein FKN15_062500 [Acipenser sinensis]